MLAAAGAAARRPGRLRALPRLAGAPGARAASAAAAAAFLRLPDAEKRRALDAVVFGRLATPPDSAAAAAAQAFLWNVEKHLFFEGVVLADVPPEVLTEEVTRAREEAQLAAAPAATAAAAAAVKPPPAALPYALSPVAESSPASALSPKFSAPVPPGAESVLSPGALAPAAAVGGAPAAAAPSPAPRPGAPPWAAPPAVPGDAVLSSVVRRLVARRKEWYGGGTFPVPVAGGAVEEQCAGAGVESAEPRAAGRASAEAAAEGTEGAQPPAAQLSAPLRPAAPPSAARPAALQPAAAAAASAASAAAATVARKRQIAVELCCLRTQASREERALRSAALAWAGAGGPAAAHAEAAAFAAVWGRWAAPLAKALQGDPALAETLRAVEPELAAAVAVRALLTAVLVPPPRNRVMEAAGGEAACGAACGAAGDGNGAAAGDGNGAVGGAGRAVGGAAGAGAAAPSLDASLPAATRDVLRESLRLGVAPKARLRELGPLYATLGDAVRAVGRAVSVERSLALVRACPTAGVEELVGLETARDAALAEDEVIRAGLAVLPHLLAAATVPRSLLETAGDGCPGAAAAGSHPDRRPPGRSWVELARGAEARMRRNRLFRAAALARLDEAEEPAAEVPVFQRLTLAVARKKSVALIGFSSPRVSSFFLRFRAASIVSDSRVEHAPMVVPPRPWDVHRNSGAYLMRPAVFLRNAEGGCDARLRAVLRGNLPPAAARLATTVSRLGAQPWRVNRAVLAVAQQLWAEQRVPVKGFPPTVQLAQVAAAEPAAEPAAGLSFRPLPAAALPPLAASGAPGPAADDLAAAVRAGNFDPDNPPGAEVEAPGGGGGGAAEGPALSAALRRRLISEVPTFLLRLRTAADFAAAPRIYFPHFLDFRGRAYPVPPYLNHQAGDLCRGLLKFAEPRRLGTAGWYWLRAHAAALWGLDKAPFAARVAWTEENLPLLRRVAAAPVREAALWALREKPFQWLAAAQEVAAAAAGPGRPEDFLSALPVHQDGTCNGLQHYAALGGDESGARSVNLMPAAGAEAAPSDIYSVVAERCVAHFRSEARKAGAAAAEAAASAIVSKKLVTRATVKTTVMTICYGVTPLGAMRQVASNLARDFPGLTAAEVHDFSAVISRQILASVDDLFAQAMSIKRWFNQVSAVMSRSGACVSWLSPAGLPCVQNYAAAAAERVVRRGRLAVRVGAGRGGGGRLRVNAARQCLGLPPNFTHSLDASHMLFTAEACHDAGIAFAAVHDSFWTHAADVPIMNRLLREQFVRLYSPDSGAEDVIHAFAASLRHRGFDVPDPPPRGSLDVSCVLESPYFFH